MEKIQSLKKVGSKSARARGQCDQLTELLALASGSTKCIVAVTHVRNLLATPTILYGGDIRKIPVRGDPPTNSLVWVEKNGERWKLRLENGPDRVPVDGVVG